MTSWQKSRDRQSWSGGLAEWASGDAINISVVFSWMIEGALERARYWRRYGREVRMGGPAIDLNPDWVDEPWIRLGGEVGALPYHNTDATFTTRGCPRKCRFCAVPKIEGDLVELEDWDLKSVVCDNNILAASEAHFDRVVDRFLESDLVGIDFNQGLDARLMTERHASRLVELHRAKKLRCVRLAWDSIGYEGHFRRAHSLLVDAGMPRSKIRVYVLIGFRDTPRDALYRLESIRGLGSVPYPMRYQPMDARKKNQYVDPRWTNKILQRFVRYWSNLRHLGAIPFLQFR